MSRILVSVRSVGEARAALAGGADIIDVKEPARGALGRADGSVIAEIVRGVGERVPVSAALGELIEFDHQREIGVELCGLTYAKLGLAGWAARSDWPAAMDSVRALFPAEVCWVAVGYADWQRADAPSIEAVFQYAVNRRCRVMLIDTFVKDGRSLVEWMGVEEIAALVERAHDEHMEVALAGSLGAGDISALAGTGADIFAFRSAACVGGDRGGEIDSEAVKRLVDALRSEAVLAIEERSARRAG